MSIKAILVSVDYADLLAITLPYNRHHFDEVLVVTAPHDVETARVAEANRAVLHATDSFYKDGATFNKWRALEEGLDVLGRNGWLCLMDADVLWPKGLRWAEKTEGLCLAEIQDHLGHWNQFNVYYPIGSLLTPMRRMWDEWPEASAWVQIPDFLEQHCHQGLWLPEEKDWQRFPLHRQQQEFAGYSQIFHAADPCLGPAPWHQTNWKHAGGADSFFQAKWSDSKKIRPPFEVLHLGPAGQNWFGRATPLVDGTLLPNAARNRSMSGSGIWQRRRENVARGKDRFDGEKIDSPPQGD